jgi:hypothetical protein
LSLFLKDRLLAFLTANAPHGYCSGCLAESLESPVPEVEEILPAVLVTQRDLKEDRGMCESCREFRPLVRASRR